MIRPGEEVHYVALLNEKGDTLITIPLTTPVECPDRAEDVSVNVKVNLTLRAKT